MKGVRPLPSTFGAEGVGDCVLAETLSTPQLTDPERPGKKVRMSHPAEPDREIAV
jgi:hypothetical protein